MDGSINYAEYTVTQKAEGKFLKRKLFWLAVYGLIIFAYIGLMVKLRITEVYGPKREEVVFENLLSEFSSIGPMDEAHREKWENADRILECRGSMKSPESYYARLEKDGKSMEVRFEAINKMIKSMKFYNSSATDVKEMRF